MKHPAPLDVVPLNENIPRDRLAAVVDVEDVEVTQPTLAPSRPLHTKYKSEEFNFSGVL